VIVIKDEVCGTAE